MGPNNQWAWWTDRTLANADKTALSRCGTGCQLVMRDGIGNAPAFAWGNATPVRGNYSVGGYTEGKGDHGVTNNRPDPTQRDYWAVDLYADATAVYPTRAGKVIFSGLSCKPNSYPCYGNAVAIDHGSGIYSIYTHLAAIGLPALDQQVTPETSIGTMSDSGCPPSVCGTPIHLHYALRSGPSGLRGEDALYSSQLRPVRSPWHK